VLHTRVQPPQTTTHSTTHSSPRFSSRNRSERLAKYNQLLRIEEELGEGAVYAGDNYRHIPIA